MALLERRARVVGVRALSPSVRSLLLDAGDPPLTFTAGQWLNLHVPVAGRTEKRAYSIASGPRAPLLELAVTCVPTGAVSPALHALEPGAELSWDGPHGFFTRDAEAREEATLFVGTGTGLAPLRSMLTDILQQPQHPSLTLLFGVRSQADILWREELEHWAARDARFKLVVTLSRPEPGWTGRVGHVQAHVAELARELGEPHVFICGLQRMVGDVRALCKRELGYDRKRIHSERYD